MNTSLLRYAFMLILVSLIASLFIPLMAIPKLGLSAHTIGVLSGVLLIAVGAIWPHFRLSQKQQLVLKWSWIYSGYANWFGCLLGAILGAGRMTPIASSGVAGPPVAEDLVAVVLVSVAITSFTAVGLSIWGLRTAPASAPSYGIGRKA